jgi:predicted Rdx family selenoprotein
VESNKKYKLLTPQWVAVELLKSKIKDQATHTIKPKSGSITVNTVTVLNRTRSPTFAMVSY